MKRALPLFLLCGWLGTALAAPAPVTVQNLRQWRAPDHTRLVLDLSAPLEHKLTQLSDPPRIVIDLNRARASGRLGELEAEDPLIAAVRVAKADNGSLRVVVELKSEVRPKSFLLKPVGPYGHRLVIDLFDAKQPDEEARDAEEPPKPAAPLAVTPSAKPAPREFVVAVDAGHGGEDPGAMGKRFRTREKDVTLAIARELAQQINATPGMRAVLTREGDYFIPLRERWRKAKRQRADIFVSIHADAVPGQSAQGSSVYALATRGASDSVSRRLAERENAADQIGGVYLRDKDAQVQQVLVDLSQTKMIEYSLQLAGDILSEIRDVGPVHLARVGQAGFMVLKSADFPSVLVETAFISNPSEEKKLRTPGFQRELAASVLAGIKRYARRNPAEPAPAVAREVSVPTPTPATREHVVRPGETLTSIARQYNVHIELLRLHNNLADSNPPAGARLRIPGRGES
jgi:N-acetylmuramoyl-L-alanine amidase